jgi:hypothetical protein
MSSYGRVLLTLRAWLDSWAGIGRFAVGMVGQGYALQLTRHDERGWRATFYTKGMEHSPTSAPGIGWDARPRTRRSGRRGRRQTRERRCLTIGRSRRTGPLRASLRVPNVEASDVELQSLWEVGTDALHYQVILRDRFPASVTRFSVGGTAEDLRAIAPLQNPAREPVPDARA